MTPSIPVVSTVSTTAPVALNAASMLAALQTGIKLNISGTLPGEAVLTAAIQYATMVRSGMSPDLQKRLDAILVQQMEDLQHVWRGVWVAMGVVK